jgi:uncharacterized membrane protein
MENKDPRPRIKIKLTLPDWITEFIAISFLIILIALPLIYYNSLPDRIPVHFNGAGFPDGFGSKSTLWILPITAVFLYILITVLEAFPHIYNFPVKITTGNAATQYRLATRLLRILKTVLLILFSFMSYKTIRTATGDSAGLGKAFLPVFLLITFGVVIVYIVHSLNNRQSS